MQGVGWALNEEYIYGEDGKLRLLRGPTITIHLLFVFVVLRHHRHELLHVNVTDHRPPVVWTARQVVEVFPEEPGAKYLLRDRDSVYGEAFTRRVDHMVGCTACVVARPTSPGPARRPTPRHGSEVARGSPGATVALHELEAA